MKVAMYKKKKPQSNRLGLLILVNQSLSKFLEEIIDLSP